MAGTQGLRITGLVFIDASPAAPNTYTGGTIISNGVLGFFNDEAFGDPSGRITLDVGTLYTPFFSSGDFTSARNFTLTSAGTNTIYGSGGTSILLDDLWKWRDHVRRWRFHNVERSQHVPGQHDA